MPVLWKMKCLLQEDAEVCHSASALEVAFEHRIEETRRLMQGERQKLRKVRDRRRKGYRKQTIGNREQKEL